MSGVNKVLLLGRLGRDPESKNAGGIQICNFSIATSKSWKDDSGTKQERTEWHSIVAFKRLADIAGKYLTKGRQVYIEGELQTRSWDDENGKKKYRTEIIARDIQFIGEGKPKESGEQADAPGPEPKFDNSDDIPF